MGVSATVEGADPWAVDPEALILFTVGIAHRDPRLFDEMLDWTASNRELLSVQRLRNLAGRFPLPPGLVAARHGFIRPPAVRTGKSREPDLALAVNLSFRLRRLFGPGGRSLAPEWMISTPARHGSPGHQPIVFGDRRFLVREVGPHKTSTDDTALPSTRRHRR